MKKHTFCFPTNNIVACSWSVVVLQLGGDGERERRGKMELQRHRDGGRSRVNMSVWPELGSKGVDLGRSLRAVFDVASGHLSFSFIVALTLFFGLLPWSSFCPYNSFSLLLSLTSAFNSKSLSSLWKRCMVKLRVTTAPGSLGVPLSRLKIKGARLYAFEANASRLLQTTPTGMDFSRHF